ncbi:MAG: hypothetical protein JO033_15680 [Acidobacteriaceae bacterium]|nr:hypothetical protein [Acidobacteriota bacterium]MBV8810112.1 hypothetical protein [Acidobacteriaceae bacterium]MBV9502890.1 hypothetical protein [Acidobacteriaceae bacterium]
MAEDTNQIAYEIALERERLGRHVSELEDKFQEATNWRTYVRRNPLTMVLSVFSVGFILAFAFVRK